MLCPCSDFLLGILSFASQYDNAHRDAIGYRLLYIELDRPLLSDHAMATPTSTFASQTETVHV